MKESRGGNSSATSTSKKRTYLTAFQSNDPNQPKIIEYSSEPPIMKLAVNLSFRRGISFNEFESGDMKQLLEYARIGAGDKSKEKVNAENVKSSLRKGAMTVKNEFKDPRKSC